MNITDLIPYLGGVVPSAMTSGRLNVDPRALLIGGMMPGILNEANGGSFNLSSRINNQIPGILNMGDYGNNENNGMLEMKNMLMQTLLSNYFGNTP